MDPQVNGGVGGGNGSPNITESNSDGASVASVSRESSSNSITTPSMTRAESAITLPVSKDRSTAEAKALNRRSLSTEKLKFMKPLTKKQDPPISRELSDRARSAPLVKKFALPSTETLINDYSAALLKHILIHGRMYVSQNYICFESKIFGIKTMEVIPFKDIVILSKKSKKLKFAHGIEVGTTAQTYYFASFVSRARAFETLIKIWREHVPKDPQNLDDDDYSDDDDDGTQDYESDDSSLKKKDKKTAKEHPEELKLGRSVESQPGEYEEREREKDRERGLRRFSSPLLSRVLPKHSSASSASTSSLNDQKESTSSSTNNASPLSASSNLNNPNNNTNSNNNNNTNTASTASSETPVPSPHESEDEDDTNYDSGDGFLGSEATYQPVVNATFGVNVKTFFKIFFSDESNFTNTYHVSRNDRDMVVKKWTNSPQFGYIRDVHFLSPVKVPLGPSHTRIIETQRYHLTKNRLLIDTISMMLDIPYGDCFRVEGKWDVTLQTPESCKLVISVGVHFMKKTWFKGKIESQSIKETRESYQQWASLAPSEITKYKASNPISQPGSTAASPMLPARNGITPPPSSSSATTVSATTTTITSQSLSSSSVSTSSVSSSVENVSLEPSVSLEGSRRTSYAVDGGKFARATNLFSSISSPIQGQSIASVAWFIVFGFIFMQMYLRIAHLEGQVATLETILQPVLAKQLKDL